MVDDTLVTSRKQIMQNVMRLHDFGAGTAAERKFHRARIKNGKNFVATETANGWRFSPSKFAGYIDNGLHHAERLDHRDGRVTDVEIIRLLGVPLQVGDIGYAEVDREFESYCSAHSITPSRHPKARRYWVL